MFVVRSGISVLRTLWHANQGNLYYNYTYEKHKFDIGVSEIEFRCCATRESCERVHFIVCVSFVEKTSRLRRAVRPSWLYVDQRELADGGDDTLEASNAEGEVEIRMTIIDTACRSRALYRSDRDSER